MSDAKAVRYLLANNAALTAVVPSAKIVAGLVPQGTVMPAVAVSHVSTVRRNTVKREDKTLCTSRVQVTAMATSYPQQKQICALIRAALPRTRGAINGVQVDDILQGTEGPDFRDDDLGIYMQSLDFMVTHYE